MAITFDAERLLGRLNILESAQFQYAGTQAMRKLGFELRRDVGQHMQASFNRATPRTVGSTLYRETGGLSVGIFINQTGDEKGQSPARYLYPTSTQAGGLGSTTDALVTRFNLALRKRNLIGKDQAALNWRPAGGGGPMNAGQVQRVLTDLAAKRAFVVAKQGDSTNKALRAGIYRPKKGGGLQAVMGIMDQQPKSRVVFDFEGVVRERSQALLPGILRAELARALR